MERIKLSETIYKPNKEREPTSMPLVTFHMPQEWIMEIAEYCRQGEFNNRSELIRFAVKNLLMELRSNET